MGRATAKQGKGAEPGQCKKDKDEQMQKQGKGRGREERAQRTKARSRRKETAGGKEDSPKVIVQFKVLVYKGSVAVGTTGCPDPNIKQKGEPRGCKICEYKTLAARGHMNCWACTGCRFICLARAAGIGYGLPSHTTETMSFELAAAAGWGFAPN